MANNAFNFENRLHTIYSIEELENMIEEGEGYISDGDASYHMIKKWNREWVKRAFCATNDPNYLDDEPFSYSEDEEED